MKYGLNETDRCECRFTRLAIAFLAVVMLGVFVPWLAGVGR